MDVLDYLAAAALVSIQEMADADDGHRAVVVPLDVRNSVREISGLPWSTFNVESWSQALNRLASYIPTKIVQTEHAQPRYVFRKDAIDKSFQDGLVEDFLAVLELFDELGWDWLQESASTSRRIAQEAAKANEEQEGEEEDDFWEPLSIDRPDPALEEVAQALEQLGELVSADNGYAATEPAERFEVVSRLASGVKYLRDAPLVTASALQVYVVWPLETLAARFQTDSVVGAAASFAKEVLLAWLKARAARFLDGLFN